MKGVAKPKKDKEKTISGCTKTVLAKNSRGLTPWPYIGIQSTLLTPRWLSSVLPHVSIWASVIWCHQFNLAPIMPQFKFRGYVSDFTILNINFYGYCNWKVDISSLLLYIQREKFTYWFLAERKFLKWNFASKKLYSHSICVLNCIYVCGTNTNR